jgi:glycosyltransferase involved in cell wall biosynthesis
MPHISVLMPVYNGERYLREAIESVLKQTFQDFEFLIINDGSQDDSDMIIQSFHDKRIRYLINEKNLGLPKTLNKGLAAAQSPFIARFDCDDIMHPERLEKQCRFMKENPDVGVCGSAVQLIGKNQQWDFPEDDDQIQPTLLFECCIMHPSVIMRSSILHRYDIKYDEDIVPYGEDYDMWVRIAQHTALHNLKTPLLNLRHHEGQMTTRFANQIHNPAIAVKKQLLNRLGIQPTLAELQFHHHLLNKNAVREKSFFKQCDSWFSILWKQNEKKEQYQKYAFLQLLQSRFMMFHGRAHTFSWSLLWITYQSKWFSTGQRSLYWHLKFVLKCIFFYSKQ